MATSGSFDTEHRISGSYNTYGHFEWSQASQSVADNQTKINFSFAGRTAGSNQWVYTYNARVTVDGSGYGPWEGKMYNNTSMISNSKTITHSADGSKQFSASGSLAMVESNNTKSGSGSWWLNTIPRKATVTSASNFNDEANPTIGYENKAGNSVSSLQACIATTSDSIVAAYRDISKTGTSYTFNLTTAERNALRNLIPNANSTTVRMYVKTVIGSNTFYDYKQVTFSITNGAPTFTNFTYADTNSTTTTITGNNQYIIQNKSTLRATISSANKAVANKGASMSNYTFAISSYSGSANYSTSDINKDIGTINATTNQTLTITAKDSRGNTKAVSKSVNIVPYASPSIVPTVTRANNFEAATTIAVSGAMSLLSVGGVTKNAVNSTNGIQYRYKESSSSTWGSWTNIASTTAADGKVSTSSFILTLDNTKAFNFEFKITDKLETKTISYTLTQGQPQFFIGADGRTAVGGTPSFSMASGNAGQLEVKGNAYANNSRLIERNFSAYSAFCGGTSGDATGRWFKLGHLKFTAHSQGKMVWLRVMIGIGNNGNSNQQAYLDLMGQLGWTGSNGGRAGWSSVYYPCATGSSASTVKPRVIVTNNPLEYDIWLCFSANTYCTTNTVLMPIGQSDNNWQTIWTPNTSADWTSTEPSGTVCNISYQQVVPWSTGQKGMWTQFYWGGSARAEGTETVYTKKGTALTISFANGGSICHVIAGGSNIKIARQYCSQTYSSSINADYGVQGLAGGSKVHTRYISALVNGGSAGTGEYTTTAGSGTNQFASLASTTGGNRASAEIEFVAIRRGNTNQWSLKGNVSSSGVATSMDFEAECTASDSGFVPTVYQRYASTSNVSYFWTVLEVFEA